MPSVVLLTVVGELVLLVVLLVDPLVEGTSQKVLRSTSAPPSTTLTRKWTFDVTSRVGSTDCAAANSDAHVVSTSTCGPASAVVHGPPAISCPVPLGGQRSIDQLPVAADSAWPQT